MEKEIFQISENSASRNAVAFQTLEKQLNPSRGKRIPPLLKILTITYSLDKGGVARTAQIFAEGYQLLGIDSRVLVTTESGHRKLERGIPPSRPKETNTFFI